MILNLAFWQNISTVLVLLNFFLFKSKILGGLFLLSLIIISSAALGKIFFRKISIYRRSFFGFLLFLSLTIIFLTTWYYFYQINSLVIVLYLFVLAFFFYFKKEETYFVFEKKNIKILPSKKKLFFLGALVFLLGLAFLFFLVKKAATLEATRALWPLLPKYFLPLYSLLTLLLLSLLYYFPSLSSFFLLILHLFFSFSLAQLIFPLGFGYDPFIHQATEKYILENGFILPKNFYYLGQYTFLVFLSKLTFLSPVILDRYFVPILGATLIPLALYFLFREKYSKNVSVCLAITFFLLPFSFLTFTTPQNFADLLFILLLISVFTIVSRQNSNRLIFFFLALLTVAITLIHPIAGLASLIFCLIYSLEKLRISKKFKWGVYFCLCFLYLLIFYIFSILSPLYNVEFVNNFNLGNYFKNIFRLNPNLYFSLNLKDLSLAFLYLIYQSKTIFVLIFLLGLLFLLSRKENRQYAFYFKTAVVLWLNSFILFSFVSFPFLINYERGDFAQRIFNLGLMSLWILGLAFLGQIISFFEKKKTSLLIFLAILSLALAQSLYLSYPHQDRFDYNRGYTTSIHDFKAVEFLEKNTPEPYVVLANQQVGAAALTLYGFRYYQNKYFFYSIPTGGELGQIFTLIAYQEKVDPALIKKVMDLTGVKIVYFYLNDYWFSKKTLLPKLQKEADRVFPLENGKVWIAEFKKKD